MRGGRRLPSHRAPSALLLPPPLLTSAQPASPQEPTRVRHRALLLLPGITPRWLTTARAVLEPLQGAMNASVFLGLVVDRAVLAESLAGLERRCHRCLCCAAEADASLTRLESIHTVYEQVR